VALASPDWRLRRSGIIIPGNLFEIAIASIFFLYKKEVSINIKHIAVLLLGCSLYNICAQQYLYFCSAGYPAIFGFNFLFLTKKCDSLLLFQSLFSLTLIFYFIKKHSIPLAIPLIVSIILPQLIAIPAAVAFFILFSHIIKKNILPYRIIFIFFILFDSILNYSIRISSIYKILPRNFITILSILALTLSAFAIAKHLQKKQFKLYAAPVIVLPLILCSIAFCTYDKRSDFQKQNEPNLNQFIHETIFPQVQNYGKTFFFVEGGYRDYPRIQFSTGAYFDYTSHIGTLFHYGHFKEISKRFNLTAFKEQNKSIDLEEIYTNKILSLLENRDSLYDRINFLCTHNEIENIITSIENLKFPKKDSRTMQNGQTITLYSCRE